VRVQNPARVVLSRGDRARVLWDHQECEAIVAGSLLFSGGELPVTGDWVGVRPVEPDLVLIQEILPRRSKIARRAAGKRADEQVLAANVDLAFIVCGLDGDFNVRRLERYLAICADGGVAPVVILNKADLCADTASFVSAAGAVARDARVLAVSAQTGAGCEHLAALLGDGVTAVLLGSSGAGKSSLLNRLLDAEVHATSPVRESDLRGRHTTTNRELLSLPSGAALIDTPGLREIQLLASEESIDSVFGEIAEFAAHCQFRDCSHINEPGCAVRDAVPPDRLESYHKLRREAARLSGQLTEKQRWRAIHKRAKQFYKQRGR
jgi:ribosome biogenesis GTPase / thiamine phosphate phosphatase